MNFVEAGLVERDGKLTPRFGPHELAVPAGRVDASPRAQRDVVLGIRPEDIDLAHGTVANGSTLDVAVDIREDMGAEVFLHFTVDAPAVAAEALKEMAGEEAREGAPCPDGQG